MTVQSHNNWTNRQLFWHKFVFYLFYPLEFFGLSLETCQEKWTLPCHLKHLIINSCPSSIFLDVYVNYANGTACCSCREEKRQCFFFIHGALQLRQKFLWFFAWQEYHTIDCLLSLSSRNCDFFFMFSLSISKGLRKWIICEAPVLFCVLALFFCSFVFSLCFFFLFSISCGFAILSCNNIIYWVPCPL